MGAWTDYPGRVTPPLPIAVLTCASCGAPLAVTDAPSAECRACGHAMPLPEAYVALRRYGHEARAARREAERLYSKLVTSAPPEIVATRFARFGIPALIVLSPTFLYLTQSLVGWGPRTWIAFGVFVPPIVGILVYVGLVGRANPLAYLHAVGGRIQPGIPTSTGEPTCGACGAPLAPEPDSLAATCDYCLADSWLVDVPEGHVASTNRARDNLANLMLAGELHRFELWTLAIVSFVVVGGLVLAIYLI